MRDVSGVGPNTAWSILAYLHEITSLKRNERVALAGLASYNRECGKYKGKRSIQGGRTKVRRTLYMAAQSAAQHNPHIKADADRLQQKKGKPYKYAMTAVTREATHTPSIATQKTTRLRFSRCSCLVPPCLGEKNHTVRWIRDTVASWTEGPPNSPHPLNWNRRSGIHPPWGCTFSIIRRVSSSPSSGFSWIWVFGFTPLTNHLPLVGDHEPFLFQDLVLHSEVNQRAGVEMPSLYMISNSLSVKGCDLVFDHLERVRLPTILPEDSLI